MAVQMDSMGGYLSFLGKMEQKEELIVINGMNIKSVPLKESKYIFELQQFFSTEDEIFDALVVIFRDIRDDSTYYGGFFSVTSITKNMCAKEINTYSVDAENCQEVVPKSYETKFAELFSD